MARVQTMTRGAGGMLKNLSFLKHETTIEKKKNCTCKPFLSHSCSQSSHAHGARVTLWCNVGACEPRPLGSLPHSVVALGIPNPITARAAPRAHQRRRQRASAHDALCPWFWSRKRRLKSSEKRIDEASDAAH